MLFKPKCGGLYPTGGPRERLWSAAWIFSPGKMVFKVVVKVPSYMKKHKVVSVAETPNISGCL